MSWRAFNRPSKMFIGFLSVLAIEFWVSRVPIF
jgi:hypothetical protein